MILCLCLLLPVLSPSSQEICSAPGALPAPTLYLSQTSAWPGVSVWLQCSVISHAPATHIVFCKDGEKITSQKGVEEKVIYSWDLVVSMGSSGNYSCGYEIKDSNNRVNGSQLSPAQHLSITEPSPSSQEICSAPGALRAPTLYLSKTSAQPGVSVWLQCSMISRAPVTRVVFCKDGEEVSSQIGSEEEVDYNYVHPVSRGSTGNYSCRYEIKDSDNRVTRSQLSPAQHLSITGSVSSSGGGEEPTRTAPSPSSPETCSAPALSPSSQEICSAPGTRRAPTLHLSPTSARPNDSVLLQCSVFSRAPTTRIIFCKDGEEISSKKGSEEVIYSWDHTVSRGSSGNYSCGYEIKDRDNRVSRSQLSLAKHLSITGSANSSGGGEEPTRTGPAMSLTIWAARCTLVLLLLVSAPIITFVMEKRDLSEPAGLEETRGGSASIFGEEAKGDPH